MTTKRKAYVREMNADWWTKLGFYKAYMVREATAIPTVWFCLVLLYGLISLGNGTFATDFLTFLKNPLIVIFNLVSLVAMLYHAKTLFIMTPQVLDIMVKGEKLPVEKGAKIMWGITAVISVIVLALAL